MASSWGFGFVADVGGQRMTDRAAARIVEYMAGPQVVWAFTGMKATPEMVALMCNGDLPTRAMIAGQVVIR